MNEKNIESIDLTPTWAGITPGLLAAFANGGVEGHKAAEAELRKMAALADRYVVATKRAGGVINLERLLDR